MIDDEALAVVRRIAGAVHAQNPQTTVVDYDDLVGVATVALVECAGRYDASRNVPFLAFALPRVRGAMWDAIAAATWAPRSVMRRGAGRAVHSLDALREDDSRIDIPDAREYEACGVDVARLLEHLPPREREVVERHYLKGEELRSIAQSFGVTPSRISQIHSRALDHMREAV